MKKIRTNSNFNIKDVPENFLESCCFYSFCYMFKTSIPSKNVHFNQYLASRGNYATWILYLTPLKNYFYVFKTPCVKDGNCCHYDIVKNKNVQSIPTNLVFFFILLVAVCHCTEICATALNSTCSTITQYILFTVSGSEKSFLQRFQLVYPESFS